MSEITKTTDPRAVPEAHAAWAFAEYHALVLRLWEGEREPKMARIVADAQKDRDTHQTITGWSCELQPDHLVFRYIDPATRETGGELITIKTERKTS